MHINRPSVTAFRKHPVVTCLCDSPGRCRRRIRTLRILQRSRGSAEVPREKTKSSGSPSGFFVGISFAGQISSGPLGPQNLAEEGDYFREIQVGEMLSFWPDIFIRNYLYERGWVRLPATYVFPIGNAENQWSFCWLGGVKVVQGDRSDGRILQTETRGGKLAGVKLEEANKDASPRLQLMLLLGYNITPGAKFLGPARVPDLTSLGLSKLGRLLQESANIEPLLV